MIKIVKSGQKEFYATCDMCACEFTYELSDLKLSCSSNKVACPTCGKDYYHKPQNGGGYGIDYINWPKAGEPIPCITTKTNMTDPCAGCAWKENLKQGGVYVGDTPCTWCNKNRFNVITAKQPSLEDYTTPCVNELEANLTDCNCGPNAVCSKCSGTSGTITTASNADSYCTTSKEQGKTTPPVDCLCNGDVWKTISACCTSCVDEITARKAAEPKCKMQTYEG